MSKGPATAALAGLALAIALGAYFLARGGTIPESASPAGAPSGARTPEPSSGPGLLTETPSAVRREEAPSSSADRPAEPAAAAEHATLLVLVLSTATRKPLEDVRMRVFGGGVGGQEDEFVMPGRSGTDGRARFVVPSGVPLEIDASPGDGLGGHELQRISELDPGELRELVLDLPVGVDLRFVCRVVDGASHDPIRGALARVVGRPGSPKSARVDDDTIAEARTGTDGLFVFDLESRRGAHVRIEAEGFGVALVQPVPGHESEHLAFQLRLSRCATLEATLLDAASAPLRGSGIRLTADGRELNPVSWLVDGPWITLPEETWFGEVDDEGRTVLRGLPSGVPLRVDILQSDTLLRRLPDPLVLDPGQVLEREWRIGAGTTILGHALEAQDRPVPGLEIWLVRAESDRPRYFQDGELDVAARATTDAEGRFEFADVSPGRWWIGPRAVPHSISSDAAPLAIPIETGGSAMQPVLLRVHRGLSIRGIVLDSKGEPANEGSVHASMEGADWGLFADVAESGTFSLGPLAPGRFLLRAESWGNDAPSDSVEVEGGSADVVLRLRPGGTLGGRVFDAASGEAVAAEVLIALEVSRSELFGDAVGMTTQEDGVFEEEGLEPGTYGVAARTYDGKFGVAVGVAVDTGTENPEVRIAVSPGGTLELRHEGPQPKLHLNVLISDVQVTWWTPLPRGKRVSVACPAGRLRLEFRDFEGTGSQPLSPRSVELKPGERKEIVLRDGE